VGGNAEKLMMTKPETWGKGLLFFDILKKSYKEELHRADLLKKEKEYSLLFQTSSESVDDFAARCIQLRNQLVDNGVSASTSGLRDRFLMGLGPILTEIQQTPYEDLPVRWQTDDIQTLINIAVSYKDEKLAVRERNRLFNEANRTPAKKDKEDKQQPKSDRNRDQKKPSDNDSRKPSSSNDNDQNSWSVQNSQRQARIEIDIKNGVFDPRWYNPDKNQDLLLLV